MSETKLTNACLEWLWEHGIPAFRVNSGNVFVGGAMVRGAPPGTPDIIGWWPVGTGMFGIENKVGRNGLRPAQADWAGNFGRRISRHGNVDYFLARSVQQLDDMMQGYAMSWRASPFGAAQLRELLSAPTKEKAGLARIAPKGRIVDESTPADYPAPARVRRPRRAK